MGVRSLEELAPRTTIAVQKLRRFIQSRGPLMDPGGVRVFLDSARGRARYLYVDLLQINWSSLVFLMGRQGYGEKRFDSARDLGQDPDAVVVEELQAFYSDLLELGRDLKLIDPAQWDAARIRFRDGNLFMPASNGDMKLLSVAEASEVIAVMVSAKATSLGLYNPLTSICRSIPGGIFQTKMIDIPCFREELKKGLDEYFFNMPGFVKYLRQLESVEREQFIDLLFEVSLVPNDHPGFIDINELDRFTMIIHYLELMFVSFDIDSSGLLSASESLTAYDRFQIILKEILKDQNLDDDGIRALFTYMLTRGKPPETAFEKAGFIAWKLRGPERWKMSVDRHAILKVLAKLSVGATSASK